MTTTAYTMDGYRIDKTLGVVCGIIVRSRSVFGTIGAGLQTLVGGDITLFTQLCETTRNDAFDRRSPFRARLEPAPCRSGPQRAPLFRLAP